MKWFKNIIYFNLIFLSFVIVVYMLIIDRGWQVAVNKYFLDLCSYEVDAVVMSGFFVYVPIVMLPAFVLFVIMVVDNFLIQNDTEQVSQN